MVAYYPTFKSCPSTEIPQGIAEQDNAAWYHWIMYSWVRPLLDRGEGGVAGRAFAAQVPIGSDDARAARRLEDQTSP